MACRKMGRLGLDPVYRCALALYLMSAMFQFYSGISAPGNGKEVVDGINSIDKKYIHQLTSNV